MKRLFLVVLLLSTSWLYAANFTVLDFMELDGADPALVSGTYDTFVNNFKPSGFVQISKFKVRKTAQDMGIQLSTATPPQMKPVMDKLKVTHIVLGKVRKIGGEYVVTVSFIKAGTDSPIATEETHFSGSHVEPVKVLAQNLAKKLRGGKGGGKTQTAAPAPAANEPGIIYGYLKVFPKDLGPFPNDPEDIIEKINTAQQFGYDTWRIPTENELALLVTEGYIKNAQGYMSDVNSSGKLRLVTDQKTAKELAEAAAAEEARELEMRRREEAERRAEEAARREQYLNGRRIGNLIWSDCSANQMDWSSAKEYCEDLTEGGFDDWRLPNIDELRTLIQNHSGTQSGGSCPISERAGKLAGRDWTSDCGSRYGSNFSKLGDTGWFWSSSTKSANSDYAWLVNFGNGYVNDIYKYYDYSVRCVR